MKQQAKEDIVLALLALRNSGRLDSDRMMAAHKALDAECAVLPDMEREVLAILEHFNNTGAYQSMYSALVALRFKIQAQMAADRT